jgi:hypothetical protein
MIIAITRKEGESSLFWDNRPGLRTTRSLGTNSPQTKTTRLQILVFLQVLD